MPSPSLSSIFCVAGALLLSTTFYLAHGAVLSQFSYLSSHCQGTPYYGVMKSDMIVFGSPHVWSCNDTTAVFRACLENETTICTGPIFSDVAVGCKTNQNEDNTINTAITSTFTQCISSMNKDYFLSPRLVVKTWPIRTTCANNATDTQLYALDTCFPKSSPGMGSTIVKMNGFDGQSFSCQDAKCSPANCTSVAIYKTGFCLQTPSGDQYYETLRQRPVNEASSPLRHMTMMTTASYVMMIIMSVIVLF
eukprot:TRINITY_DN2439_c0_g1_i2.p1 TRINITY_DN2439_c0_g1~~TRINITY_DN2439_c0_g1_i2.p1  ORF type:complete len:250 (+),score=28.90 TRINITY_DN2439_c0_g1_i2:48-797(+)